MMVGPRVALITGACRGIGKSIAQRLSKDGFHVMLNDLPTQREALVAVERDIKEKGGKAATYFADVSGETEVKAMVADTVKLLGSLDVMVANAGLLISRPFLETSVKDFNRIYSVNILGTHLCYLYAAKQMIEQGRGGRIIGASSLAGKQGWPFLSLYSSSKFAIRGLTQAAAKELAGYDITVNAYAPGPVDTKMMEDIRQNVPSYFPDKEGADAALATMVPPTGRDTKPEEVASLVSFLVSKEASMITGQTISINGGMYFD